MALVELTAPGDQGTAPGMTAAAAETSGTTPRWQVVGASFAAIIGFWILGVTINRSFKPTALVIPAGVSIFAMLYAVTQGLERLLEPISSFFFSTKQHTQFRNAAMAAAVNLQSASEKDMPARLTELTEVTTAAEGWMGKESPAVFRHNPARKGVAAACKKVIEHGLPAPNADGHDRDQAGTNLAHGATATATAARAAATTPATNGVAAVARTNAVKLAAAAQADLDQRRADKTIAYWALASVLGVMLSATLGLYLLHTVGLRGDGLSAGGAWTGSPWNAAGVRHMLDLLATGLALGGGTKPLHDLISNLQTSKNNKKDPGQTQ
jgi:hypothetical protein